VEVNVIHDLMSHTPIVLQNVIVLSVHCLSDLLCDGQDLGELVVGDIVEFCAVVFGDDELGEMVRGDGNEGRQGN
jgi:hypothetical protein